MAALTNQTAAADVVKALDVEMATRFTNEVNQLTEVLGIFGVETVAAGTALKQITISGSLNASEVAEGDETPLSKYSVTESIIGEIKVKPYRKLTTAQAILKAGFVNAVAKTDNKMVKDIRASVVADFFKALAAGTGTANGDAGTGLQGALAKTDAALGNELEKNSDSADRIVHFVNRDDIAGYLSTANVTTQTVFGMEYLKNFLGVTDVFVTSKVASGTVYATPVDNLHIYGIDFAALADGNLSYTAESGIIGVHHDANYARTSSETQALVGVAFVPEVKNYIVKGTITPAAA